MAQDNLNKNSMSYESLLELSIGAKIKKEDLRNVQKQASDIAAQMADAINEEIARGISSATIADHLTESLKVFNTVLQNYKLKPLNINIDDLINLDKPFNKLGEEFAQRFADALKVRPEVARQIEQGTAKSLEKIVDKLNSVVDKLGESSSKAFSGMTKESDKATKGFLKNASELEGALKRIQATGQKAKGFDFIKDALNIKVSKDVYESNERLNEIYRERERIAHDASASWEQQYAADVKFLKYYEGYQRKFRKSPNSQSPAPSFEATDRYNQLVDSGRTKESMLTNVYNLGKHKDRAMVGYDDGVYATEQTLREIRDLLKGGVRFSSSAPIAATVEQTPHEETEEEKQAKAQEVAARAAQAAERKAKAEERKAKKAEEEQQAAEKAEQEKAAAEQAAKEAAEQERIANEKRIEAEKRAAAAAAEQAAREKQEAEEAAERAAAIKAAEEATVKAAEEKAKAEQQAAEAAKQSAEDAQKQAYRDRAARAREENSKDTLHIYRGVQYDRGQVHEAESFGGDYYTYGTVGAAETTPERALQAAKVYAPSGERAKGEQDILFGDIKTDQVLFVDAGGKEWFELDKMPGLVQMRNDKRDTIGQAINRDETLKYYRSPDPATLKDGDQNKVDTPGFMAQTALADIVREDGQYLAIAFQNVADSIRIGGKQLTNTLVVLDTSLVHNVKALNKTGDGKQVGDVFNWKYDNNEGNAVGLSNFVERYLLDDIQNFQPQSVDDTYDLIKEYSRLTNQKTRTPKNAQILAAIKKILIDYYGDYLKDLLLVDKGIDPDELFGEIAANYEAFPEGTSHSKRKISASDRPELHAKAEAIRARQQARKDAANQKALAEKEAREAAEEAAKKKAAEERAAREAAYKAKYEGLPDPNNYATNSGAGTFNELIEKYQAITDLLQNGVEQEKFDALREYQSAIRDVFLKFGKNAEELKTLGVNLNGTAIGADLEKFDANFKQTDAARRADADKLINEQVLANRRKQADLEKAQREQEIANEKSAFEQLTDAQKKAAFEIDALAKYIADANQRLANAEEGKKDAAFYEGNIAKAYDAITERKKLLEGTAYAANGYKLAAVNGQSANVQDIIGKNIYLTKTLDEAAESYEDAARKIATADDKLENATQNAVNKLEDHTAQLNEAVDRDTIDGAADALERLDNQLSAIEDAQKKPEKKKPAAKKKGGKRKASAEPEATDSQAQPEVEQTKVATEKAKAEVEQAKVETEKAKAETEQAKVETEKAKVEVEKAKVEVEKAKPADTTDYTAEIKGLVEKEKLDQQSIVRLLNIYTKVAGTENANIIKERLGYGQNDYVTKSFNQIDSSKKMAPAMLGIYAKNIVANIEMAAKAVAEEAKKLEEAKAPDGTYTYTDGKTKIAGLTKEEYDEIVAEAAAKAAKTVETKKTATAGSVLGMLKKEAEKPAPKPKAEPAEQPAPQPKAEPKPKTPPAQQKQETSATIDSLKQMLREITFKVSLTKASAEKVDAAQKVSVSDEAIKAMTEALSHISFASVDELVNVLKSYVTAINTPAQATPNVNPWALEETLSGKIYDALYTIQTNTTQKDTTDVALAISQVATSVSNAIRQMTAQMSTLKVTLDPNTKIATRGGVTVSPKAIANAIRDALPQQQPGTENNIEHLAAIIARSLTAAIQNSALQVVGLDRVAHEETLIKVSDAVYAIRDAVLNSNTAPTITTADYAPIIAAIGALNFPTSNDIKKIVRNDKVADILKAVESIVNNGVKLQRNVNDIPVHPGDTKMPGEADKKHGTSINHGSAGAIVDQKANARRVLDYNHWLEEQVQIYDGINAQYVTALKEVITNLEGRVTAALTETTGEDGNPKGWYLALEEKHRLHTAKNDGANSNRKQMTDEQRAVQLLKEEYKLRLQVEKLKMAGAEDSEVAPLLAIANSDEILRDTLAAGFTDGAKGKYAQAVESAELSHETALKELAVRKQISDRKDAEAKAEADRKRQEADAERQRLEAIKRVAEQQRIAENNRRAALASAAKQQKIADTEHEKKVREFVALYKELAKIDAQMDSGSIPDEVKEELKNRRADVMSRIKAAGSELGADVDAGTRARREYADTKQERTQALREAEAAREAARRQAEEVKQQREADAAEAKRQRDEEAAEAKRKKDIEEAAAKRQKEADAAHKKSVEELISLYKELAQIDAQMNAESVPDEVKAELQTRRADVMSRIGTAGRALGSDIDARAAARKEYVDAKKAKDQALREAAAAREAARRQAEEAREQRQQEAIARAAERHALSVGRTDARLSLGNSTYNKGDELIRQLNAIQDIDPAIVSRIKKYQEALNNLNAKRKALAEKRDAPITAEEAENFRQETVEVRALNKEFETLLRQHNKSAGAESVIIGNVASAPGGNKETITELMSAVRAYTDGTAKFEKYNAKTGELTYTMKTGEGTVTQYTASISKLNGTINVTTGATVKADTILNKLAKTFGQYKSYLVNLLSAYRVIGYIKQGINYVRQLDTALTELKKVTDATDNEYRRFIRTANEIGKAIGSTTKDVLNASAEFARLGYSMTQSADMAKAAIVYKNVGDGINSASDAASSIISTMKAFGMQSDEAMSVVDRFNEVGKHLPKDNYNG